MPIRNVVFIPSQLQTADLWAPQIAALSGSANMMVADNTRHDSIRDLATSILHRAPDHFAVVGLAMGGFIALEMLRQSPERIESLTLMNTLAAADTPQQTERRMGYLRMVEGGKFSDVVEERIPILLHPDNRKNEALLAIVRKMAADTGAETFLNQQRAIMGRQDSRPSLAAISCPALILFGREDGITTLANQEELQKGIPNARLEIIERCGHLLPLEQPVKISHLLDAWLSA